MITDSYGNTFLNETWLTFLLKNAGPNEKELKRPLISGPSKETIEVAAARGSGEISPQGKSREVPARIRPRGSGRMGSIRGCQEMRSAKRRELPDREVFELTQTMPLDAPPR
jgi:hypothetical protein